MKNNIYTINREEEFSLIVSHEMREPLRLLCNYARILENQAGALSPELHQYVSIIDATATSLYNLVTSLLEYSQAGIRQMGKPERFDTAEAIAEAL